MTGAPAPHARRAAREACAASMMQTCLRLEAGGCLDVDVVEVLCAVIDGQLRGPAPQRTST